MRQAVQVLACQGRAALAGITRKPFEVDSYQEVIGREAEIVGVSDHLLQEFPLLMDFARRGVLNLSHVVTQNRAAGRPGRSTRRSTRSSAGAAKCARSSCRSPSHLELKSGRPAGLPLC